MRDLLELRTWLLVSRHLGTPPEVQPKLVTNCSSPFRHLHLLKLIRVTITLVVLPSFYDFLPHTTYCDFFYYCHFLQSVLKFIISLVLLKKEKNLHWSTRGIDFQNFLQSGMFSIIIGVNIDFFQFGSLFTNTSFGRLIITHALFNRLEFFWNEIRRDG